MFAIQNFFTLLTDYQLSKQVLKKCVFFKRNFKGKDKIGDMNAFWNFDKSTEEVLISELQDLIEESEVKKWEIAIRLFHINKNQVSLQLLRSSAMKTILFEISESQFGYRSTNLFHCKIYNICCEECSNDLTRLRMKTAAQVVASLVSMGGGSVVSEPSTEAEVVRLSHTVNKDSEQAILVNTVKMSSGLYISETDLFQLRTEEMLAMSDHKNLCEQSLSQLVSAVVVFDLLSIKLEKPLVLDLLDQPKSSKRSNCKGGSFVLYNYVRLCAILERFDHSVAKGLYRPLPSLHDIDYSILSEEEEWSLVFDLLAQWPAIVVECQDLCQPKLHQITGFLSSLSSTFSIYYRHTRILNDGLTHMLPLMEARIHLLLAIKQVFLIAFSLLGITAPKAM